MLYKCNNKGLYTSKLDNLEKKDGKHTTCIVPNNDPPLEDTQGN